MVDNEFGGGNYDEDKARILLVSFAFKNPTKASYLTFNAKKAINFLWHVFTQAPTFQYFAPKWHIRIEINMSGYAISGVLSQPNLDDLGQ